MVLLIVIFEMNWSMHFILSSRHRDDYVFVENFIDVRTSTSSVVYQIKESILGISSVPRWPFGHAISYHDLMFTRLPRGQTGAGSTFPDNLLLSHLLTENKVLVPPKGLNGRRMCSSE